MHARKLTVDDIAKAMGLRIPQVWSLARNMDRAFWPTQRKLVRGKIREIDKPKPQTKRILRKLHRFLQRRVGAHPSAHGGARSRSCFTSARQHLGRRYVVTRDVKDAYPSVVQEALKRRLRRLGFRADVSLLLSLMCTVRGRLAQGSPVSSDALNLFFFDADRALSAACGPVGARYSRTYDDMVISVNRGSMSEWPGNVMRKQIEAHGLKVNARKLRDEYSFCPRHHEQRVHNLVVNNKRGVRIGEDQVKKGVGLAEAYLRGAKTVGPDSLEGLAYKRSRVTGWMHYCRQAEFGPAKHIRRLLDAGDRHVQHVLSAVELGPNRKKWWLVCPTRNEPARLAAVWRRLRTAA